MIRFFLLLALIPAAASAVDRRVSVGSFERLRVDGPFEVRMTTGSPGATISGDPRAVEAVEIRVDGGALSVRRDTGGWGEQPVRRTAPVIVTLSTPNLVSASVSAGGKLTIAQMRGMRLDLAVSGAGSIALAGADTEQLNASVIGAGKMTLAGRAARARLTTSGPGLMDASALIVSDLTILQDGVGETLGNARYTAAVTNAGTGSVTVTGTPKCTVRGASTGPVVCGD